MIRPRPWNTTDRLFFLTLAVCGGLGVQSLVTGSLNHTFLVWNLFLAWIPYCLGVGIDRLASWTEPGTGILVLPTALWLLFFPNAPYIVTDLVHLRRAAPEHLVLNGLLIASFATLGMALGLLSLRRVHAIVARRLGARTGWAFVGAVFLLTGAGVWMGRVLRWNSWDLATNPVAMLRRTVDVLLAPWNHLHAVGFTLLFAVGLFVLYQRLVVRSRVRVRAPRRLGLL